MNTWVERTRPNRLEKRFDFESYQNTRDFLDALGKQCETVNRFPDISFGKKYVNITLRPEDEDDTAPITSKDHKFATEIDELLN